MLLDLLDKKIRRLVCKLEKYNVHLEVFDHSAIEYGEVIGKGGEGMVQKCIVTYNDLPIDGAVKTILDDSDDAICLTLDEIELLCLSKDPVVNTTLRVYGVAAVPDDNDSEVGRLVIIMEAGLMNGLQLYQKEEVPLHVTFDLWASLSAAVHTLHTRKILHQDLKPENILVTAIVRDVNGQIEKIDAKIIDLGMGRRLFTDKIQTDDILGTNGYHPPEVLFEESYDFRADVFMLGVTFCVMLQSCSFLKSRQLRDMLRKLHTTKKKKVFGKALFESVLEPSIPDSQNLPPAIRSLLCNMLERQSRRKVSLVRVVATCKQEATDVKTQQSQLPPRTQPSLQQRPGFRY